MRHLAACILLTLLLVGCAAPADPDKAQESIQVIAMDTAMLITTYGERSSAAAYAAEDVIRDLEKQLSRTKEDSVVSQLNAAGRRMLVEGDLIPLLSSSGWFYELTSGAFDITVAPVVSAWGFTTDSFQVPSQEELHELLKLVDGSEVSVTPAYDDGEGTKATVRLGPGQSIDLGAIAKGYAANKVLEVFREYGLPRAKAELGGNVLVLGDRPDETPWRVGIQDPKRPDDPNGFIGVLELTDSFAVTAGGYQRYFEENGKRYHHIIDPSTGYPADSGLTSVTVVADCEMENGTMCDALSTALFIMGEEKALDFWRSGGVPDSNFELVLVTEDGRVLITEGLADRFVRDESSGYSYETIS